MKVTDWISYDEADGKTESVGWFGGWFGNGDGERWADYLAAYKPETHPYLEAIKDDVLASGRFINGGQHQNSPRGVPLFEDGTIGSIHAPGVGRSHGRDRHCQGRQRPPLHGVLLLMTNPVRAVAGTLIVAAVATFLCVVAGTWTLLIVIAAALLYVAALCYAWVLDHRRQRRKDAELARRVKERAG